MREEFINYSRHPNQDCSFGVKYLKLSGKFIVRFFLDKKRKKRGGDYFLPFIYMYAATAITTTTMTTMIAYTYSIGNPPPTTAVAVGEAVT
jgi:hypothetical protein